MKKIIIASLLSFTLTACGKEDLSIESQACTFTDPVNDAHPRAAALQALMDEYTAAGLPGISIGIYSPDGYWAGASGLSQIESNAPMQPCHLQYSQSVAKMYMAAEILHLHERGRLGLDDFITDYLPTEVTDRVTGAAQMTVRMLLNHTSGVAEYNYQPDYVSMLLQHPSHSFTSLDYLGFIEGKPVQFAAGSEYRYTNTNYLLLALLADAITGDHARYLRDSVLAPAGLNQTFYRNSPDYLDEPALVNSYWDRYSNGKVENCSQMQKVNVASLVGDDGIIAAPLEYVRFLRALMEGQILSQASLDEMLRPGIDDNGEGYGFGMAVREFEGLREYGHTGGGIGAGCEIGYFPHNGSYFFVAINLGTIIDGPIHDRFADIQDRLYAIMSE